MIQEESHGIIRILKRTVIVTLLHVQYLILGKPYQGETSVKILDCTDKSNVSQLVMRTDISINEIYRAKSEDYLKTSYCEMIFFDIYLRIL